MHHFNARSPLSKFLKNINNFTKSGHSLNCKYQLMIKNNSFLRVILVATLIFHTTLLYSKNDKKAIDQSKERLTILLKERTKKFEKYTKSIDERSGIFGIQTKRDLRKVNDILIEITQTDNVIFKELKRLLDYKSFEKANVVQDMGKYEEERNKSFAAIDTLNKQVISLREKNSELKQENITKGFLFWLMGILLLIILLLYRRLRKKIAETEPLQEPDLLEA